MTTEKTNKMLFRTFVILGFSILIIALICELTSQFSDLLPKNDMYRALMVLGWPIAWLGIYFQPITKFLENGPGCFLLFNLFFLVCQPLLWLWHIDHFTTSIVIMLSISAVLTIVDLVIAYKKSRQIKAMIEENEKK